MYEKTFKFLFFVFISVVGIYFTYPTDLTHAQKMAYIDGYKTTLILTSGGVLIGIILGFFLSFLKFLRIKILNLIIDEYIDLIRGIPLVIQLLIFVLFIFDPNLFYATIALGLNSSAYVAEIVRSGINSVDKGQMEAARAMGLGYASAMKEIILPQAIKNIIPALGNEFISLFKETAVVGMVSITDLTMKAQEVQSQLYTIQPVLFAGMIYYINVKFLTLLVSLIEKRLNKHD